jgi:hypothetical protein
MCVSVLKGCRNLLFTHVHAKTKDFADRMRHSVRTHVPALSSRIHRSLERAEVDHPALDCPDSQDMDWGWPAAEARLKKAFDNGGWAGWADAAIKEVEAEAKMERMKRVDGYKD